MECVIEVNYDPKSITNFIDNYLELPYKVTHYHFDQESENMLIVFNWFKDNVDLTDIVKLKNINEILNGIIKLNSKETFNG